MSAASGSAGAGGCLSASGTSVVPAPRKAPTRAAVGVAHHGPWLTAAAKSMRTRYRPPSEHSLVSPGRLVQRRLRASVTSDSCSGSLRCGRDHPGRLLSRLLSSLVTISRIILRHAISQFVESLRDLDPAPAQFNPSFLGRRSINLLACLLLGLDLHSPPLSNESSPFEDRTNDHGAAQLPHHQRLGRVTINAEN